MYRQIWAEFFTKENINYIFFSASFEQLKIEQAILKQQQLAKLKGSLLDESDMTPNELAILEELRNQRLGMYIYIYL